MTTSLLVRPTTHSYATTAAVALICLSAVLLLNFVPSCHSFTAVVVPTTAYSPVFVSSLTSHDGTSRRSALSKKNVLLRSTPSDDDDDDDASGSAAESSSSAPSPAAASTAGPTTFARCGQCETVYEVKESDLGLERSRGRRLECGVCGHSWFQSKERLMTMKDGFELVPLPQEDLDRIEANIKDGKQPKFMGEGKLYVGNIAFETHEDDIREIFGRVGEVGDVSLVRDNDGKNRGFGFVTMRTKSDGEKAISELDGTPVRGRKIAVRESNN